MKTLSYFILSIGLFAFSCTEEVSSNEPCITGKIVGQKCDVFALQLDRKLLGATDWEKQDPMTSEIVATYPNVIGLIDLPQEFRVEGKVLFVTLREPTAKERQISCYANMPGPPAPYYVVLAASETKCTETNNQ